MIKTENNRLEITQRIPNSNMTWQVFNQRRISHKITTTDGFHMPDVETQSFVVDWQLVVDDSFDVEKLWY